MTRRFAQFYVTLNHGVEHQLLEVTFHLIVYLVCLSQTCIEHRQQESFNLQSGIQFALDYLYERGVSKEIIDKFQLGYSPADRTWLKKFLLSKNYEIIENYIDEAGIIAKAKQEADITVSKNITKEDITMYLAKATDNALVPSIINLTYTDL